MVHVRMRDDDVAHLVTLFAGQGKRDTSSINRNTFVDEKTGQTLFGGCVALLIKGAG